MKRNSLLVAVAVATFGITAPVLSAGYITASGASLSDEQLAAFEQRQSEPVGAGTLNVLRMHEETLARESNQIAD